MTSCLRRVSSYKKVNRSILKKVNKRELEKERLLVKLEESAQGLGEMRIEKESLEVKVNILTNDLEKANANFNNFLVVLRKLMT